MSDQDLSPIALEREFRALIKAINDDGLRYTLIGGLAVAIYGYVRYTKDIDIVIDQADLPNFKKILQRLDYIIDNGRLPFPSSGFTFYRMGKFVDQTILSIDMLLEQADSPLLQKPLIVTNNEMEIVVANKQQLIAMKSKSTRDKDQIDIQRLNEFEEE
ncbi:MAG: hypothetical protein ACFCU1_04940 [Sumerlaeia bacterium]